MDDMEPTAEDVAEYINTAGGIDNPIIQVSPKNGIKSIRDVWADRCILHGVRWCAEDACKLAAFDSFMGIK